MPAHDQLPPDGDRLVLQDLQGSEGLAGLQDDGPRPPELHHQGGLSVPHRQAPVLVGERAVKADEQILPQEGDLVPEQEGMELGAGAAGPEHQAVGAGVAEERCGAAQGFLLGLAAEHPGEGLGPEAGAGGADEAAQGGLTAGEAVGGADQEQPGLVLRRPVAGEDQQPLASKVHRGEQGLGGFQGRRVGEGRGKQRRETRGSQAHRRRRHGGRTSEGLVLGELPEGLRRKGGGAAAAGGRGHLLGEQLVHATGHALLSSPQERLPGLHVVAQALEGEPEVAPGAGVVRVEHHRLFEELPGVHRLAGLEVAEGQVDAGGSLLRVLADELLEDLDGAGVHPEAKVDDAQEILPLGVKGLEPDGQLQLLLGLVDPVVLEQLAASVEVKQEIFAGDLATPGAVVVAPLGLG